MKRAEEFFEGIYGAAVQPVLIYTEAGAPAFANGAATAFAERWKVSAEALYAQLLEDASTCLQQRQGRAVCINIGPETVDLYLLPYFYKETPYLVAQVEEGGSAKDLMRILRNSGAKMNSYLNGIYGVAQRMGLESAEGERLGKDVHRLLRMKNHLYQLLDRQGTKDYLVPMELAPFVDKYVRSVMELKPDLRIRAAKLPKDLFVRMMPEDMELVLAVLVSNAVRFGKDEIILSIGRKGKKIFLTVADNGPGPQDPSRLFEWGYRTADRKGVRGLGFSLAMARQLLEGQGAGLEYARKGDQTCFTILLEPSDLPAGSVLAEWSAEPLSNSLSQLRVELSDIL